MQINKAMILTAGYGKRMLPLTEKVPKPLIKIGIKSLLERSIELLIKIGIKEIKINTHHLSAQVENFLKEKKYEISISTIYEEELLDTGGGIFNATKEFGEDPFYVLNPDTVWNRSYYEELKILENFYLTKKSPVLLLVDKKNSHDKSFKGDFNFKANNLLKRESNNLFIFTGAQIIDRSVFYDVKMKVFSMNLIWDNLIQKQKLFGQESNQTFFHVNNFQVYKELEKIKFID